MKKINVLFVCTGNTCRSCMAEGILRKFIESDLEINEKVDVSSAGISTLGGEPASENAVKALKELWNIDIQNHRSKKIAAVDLQNYDIILTMTREHKAYIDMAFPNISNKTYILKQFTNKIVNTSSLDISDPFGMPLPYYKKCAEDIKVAIEEVIQKIKIMYSGLK